jgi:DNA-binding XRE family transcriptional regulator
MAKALLEMDHQGSAMPKKLGQHIFMLRGVAKAGEPMTFIISNLLRDIGELPEESKRARDWARRTRERFDEALQRLTENKLFDKVEWPPRFSPGDQPAGRGWVEQWLNSRIQVLLPADAPAVMLQVPQKPVRAVKKIGDDQRIDTVNLREYRERLGKTQEELAEQFGISRYYYIKIENNKKVPSKKLTSKIVDFLDYWYENKFWD